MNGKDIVKLSADLAAGSITADFIKEKYGDTVLSTVLGVGAGIGVGMLTNKALDVLDRETGIVSDVGGLIDDVLDLF
jgi:hypothetical protein